MGPEKRIKSSSKQPSNNNRKLDSQLRRKLYQLQVWNQLPEFAKGGKRRIDSVIKHSVLAGLDTKNDYSKKELQTQYDLLLEGQTCQKVEQILKKSFSSFKFNAFGIQLEQSPYETIIEAKLNFFGKCPFQQLRQLKKQCLIMKYQKLGFPGINYVYVLNSKLQDFENFFDKGKDGAECWCKNKHRNDWVEELKKFCQNYNVVFSIAYMKSVEMLNSQVTYLEKERQNLGQKMTRMEQQFQQKFASQQARYQQLQARYQQGQARYQQLQARYQQGQARYQQLQARYRQGQARRQQLQARYQQQLTILQEQIKYLMDAVQRNYTKVNQKQ